jgi:hypothetical protein
VNLLGLYLVAPQVLKYKASAPQMERRQLVNKQRLLAIAFAAALAQLTGCSKVNVNLDKPRQAESQSAQAPVAINPAVPPTVLAPASVRHMPAERIVEIDRLLSEPLTGTAEDSDRRASLRAERAALVGSYTGPAPGNESSAMRDQAAQFNGLPALPQNSHIIIARDSQGDHDPHHMSELEAMTPTERARYFRYLRLTNPNPIVPGYDGRR